MKERRTKNEIKKEIAKILASKRLRGFLKVLLYILSSGILSLIVERVSGLNLSPETILLANGLINVLIYFGKNELENLRNGKKKGA